MAADMGTQATETRAASAAAIQDRRAKPHGVLPRNIQMWLMAGIALVILVIIFFTGHAAPAPRAASVPRPSEAPSESPLAVAERIRSYRQQLGEDQARQERILAQEKNLPPEIARPASPDAAVRDPLTDERLRR